jgi:hypothetical protein
MEGYLMRKNLLMLVLVVLIVATACTTYEYKPYDSTGEVTGELGLGNLSSENKTAEQKFDITAYEGDLIDLKPAVKDPDGDKITLGFTAPFDGKGEWQTKEGDEGQYSVIVTATDNKDSFVTKQIRILVVSRNRAPAIEIADKLEFNEGDLITLKPEIDDEDPSIVTVTYSGWMNSNTYQTTYQDAGLHNVTITAFDGKNKVAKLVDISVSDVNRKPELTLDSSEIIITEGQVAEIKAEATDPDGLPVELTFSEPFSKSGKWQTEKGSKGEYTATVTASDGVNEVTKEVKIIVEKKNTPPVIESLTVSPEMVVLKQPGDKVTIKVNVVASDPDGDELTYKFEGFMDSTEKTVEYGEPGGVKKVSVTVSDGQDYVNKAVTFEINNWPCFDCQ